MAAPSVVVAEDASVSLKDDVLVSDDDRAVTAAARLGSEAANGRSGATKAEVVVVTTVGGVKAQMAHMVPCTVRLVLVLLVILVLCACVCDSALSKPSRLILFLAVG